MFFPKILVLLVSVAGLASAKNVSQFPNWPFGGSEASTVTPAVSAVTFTVTATATVTSLTTSTVTPPAVTVYTTPGVPVVARQDPSSVGGNETYPRTTTWVETVTDITVIPDSSTSTTLVSSSSVSSSAASNSTTALPHPPAEKYHPYPPYWSTATFDCGGQYTDIVPVCPHRPYYSTSGVGKFTPFAEFAKEKMVVTQVADGEGKTTTWVETVTSTAVVPDSSSAGGLKRRSEAPRFATFVSTPEPVVTATVTKTVVERAGKRGGRVTVTETETIRG